MEEITIDNQILTDYTCDMYGYLRHIRGWVPRSTGMALKFGLGMHVGLHALHDTHDVVKASVAFGTEFNSEGDGLRTLEKGVEILEEYDRRFSGDPWRDLVEGGEVKATLPLSDNPPILYVVRIDRPGWLDGELWFKEWKTSSRPAGFITKPNQQITGYTWAMRELFDQPVIGALVELLGVFKNSKDGKRTIGRGRDSSTASIIERVPVVIHDWEVSNWREDVVHKVKHILQLRADGWWPKKTLQCGVWNGCPYIPLCTSPVSQWDLLVESAYEEKPWTPGGED